jgi:hypothetical protein
MVSALTREYAVTLTDLVARNEGSSKGVGK